MSVELNLLKALSTSTAFTRFAVYLNPDGLTDETKWLLDKYKLMFEDGYEYIEAEELFAFAYNKIGIKVKPELNQKLKTILFNALEISDEDALVAVQSFIENDYAMKINDLTNRMIDGDESASIEGVMEELENFKREVQFKTDEKLELVTMDLDALIEENAPKNGLRWGLNCLNEVAGCLRQGDLVIVFARPDTGKTSFVIDQTAHFLDQVPDGKEIVWFNNEEVGKRIALRYYANIHNEPQGQVSRTHTPLTNKVAIYDSPIIHKKDVEEYLKRHNPACIVFNSMDKIKGFDKAGGSDTRRLRDLYQWGRELAKTYAPVIAVCQCSADGEGVKALTMDMLADSKTDKAGEADLIIGIGRSTDATTRYINTPKNKLTGTRNDVRTVIARAVEFDSLTGRFRDMNETGLAG